MYTAPSYEAPSPSAFNGEHGFSDWDIFNTFITPDPWKYMEDMSAIFIAKKIFHWMLFKGVVNDNETKAKVHITVYLEGQP